MTGKRILIVDDHRATRQALRELLEDEGYQVGVASDGAEALELVDRFRPDLILSDLQMPRMTGEELLAHLRRCRSKVPVIVITGKPEADLGELGLVEVVRKPFDFVDILTRMARAGVAMFAAPREPAAQTARNLTGESA